MKTPCQVKQGVMHLGGSGGIRTHERRKPLPVFKTGAFNHSATLPNSVELANKGVTLPRNDKVIN